MQIVHSKVDAFRKDNMMHMKGDLITLDTHLLHKIGRQPVVVNTVRRVEFLHLSDGKKREILRSCRLDFI